MPGREGAFWVRFMLRPCVRGWMTDARLDRCADPVLGCVAGSCTGGSVCDFAVQTMRVL